MTPQEESLYSNLFPIPDCPDQAKRLRRLTSISDAAPTATSPKVAGSGTAAVVTTSCSPVLLESN